MDNVYSRTLQTHLEKWFFKKKVLVVTGARQVGKTTLLTEMVSNMKLPYLILNGEEAPIRSLFDEPSATKFKRLLGGNIILFIDEAQQIKNIGLCLKIMIDSFPKSVQIIVSGSSALEIGDKVFEPLTGRHFLFHLYPFSLNEIYTKNETVQLLQNKDWHLIYGGYPDVVNNKVNAKKYLKSIANAYLYKDVLMWKDVRKPELLEKLLQLLAHQIGNEVSINELATQLKIKAETVENYIDLLEKSFVIYRLKSYVTNERKEVTKMRKIYFWDNGIRNAVIDNFTALELRADTGALWENYLVSERLKNNHYAEREAKSFFWRSLQKQEVDYVELENMQLTGYEIKWGNKGRVTKAFTNLYPESEASVINQDNFLEFTGFY